MSFERNEQRRADTEALRAIVRKLAPGQTASWLEIEQMSGVRMDRRGRDLFRRAAVKMEGRRYEPLPGDGVRMSSAKNALAIFQGKASRIAGAVKIARDTGDVLVDHRDELTSGDRDKFDRLQGVLGALSLSVSLAKKRPPSND